MEAKGKIIMVHYIGFGPKVNQERLPHLIKQYADKMNSAWDTFDDVLNIYIPNLLTTESRLECINPVLYTEEKFSKIQNIISKMETDRKEAMEDIISEFNSQIKISK